LKVSHKLKVILVSIGWTVGYALTIGASFCHTEEKNLDGLGLT